MNRSGSRLRLHIKEMYGDKGYKECPLCGTPIRPVLWIDPTGKVQSRAGSCCAELNLDKMCEVCWKEGEVGSEVVHEAPFGMLTGV